MMKLLPRALLIFGSAAMAIFAQSSGPSLPEGKAKPLIEDQCTGCHGLDQIVGAYMTHDQWRDTVQSMAKRGAQLTPEQIGTITEYLAANFASVDINKADAAELQKGLDITAAEAESIVRYRTANGDFKNAADLQKVTGLDQKKIAARKDRIVL